MSGSRNPGTQQPARRGGVIESVRNGHYFNFPLAFRSTPKPIIAKVHGYAYGAGMDLTLASDMAIASTDARIAAIFVKRAIIGGTAQLPRMVGLKKAMEMLMTGEPLDGVQAQAAGMVNYAVPPDQLDACVQEWAKRLAAGPTRVIANIKFAALRGLDMNFNDSVAFAAVATGEAGRTEDAPEGRRAFWEKRAPAFTGQ